MHPAFPLLVAVLFTALLPALGGCRSAPERLPLLVTLVVPWAGESDQLVIRHAGRELPLKRVRHKSWPALQFEVPEAILRAERSGFSPQAEAALRFLTPCGWREVALRDWGYVQQEDIERHHAGEARLGTVASLPGDFHAGPRVTLVIDQRGVAARGLRLGEVRLALPHGDFVRYTVFAPDCPEGGMLSVDERDIAQLPPVVKLRDKLSCPPHCSFYDHYPDVLLDLGATHCYTHRTVRYGNWPGAEAKRPAVLKPALVHRVGGLATALLFEPAPESLVVKHQAGAPAIDIVGELLAVKCGG